jgi:hypothetical protein
MGKVGVVLRRSSSFMPLVVAFDLAPVNSYFLKKGGIVVRGRHLSDQCLTFEGVAIFRDVIDIMLLYSIVIRFFLVSGCRRMVEGQRRSDVGLGDCIGKGRRLQSRW